MASGTYTVTAKDANNCIVTASVVVEKNEPTSFTSTTIPSNCGKENGSLTITSVTGGTAPYTYSRDGIDFLPTATFADLTAGIYKIWVQDANGCVYDGTVQLNNTDGPADLTSTTKGATCSKENGELTVTSVVGGIAPYSYSLDGTNYQPEAIFTALAPGTYQVRVKDAADCILTEEVAVAEVPDMFFTTTAKAATCGLANGQITLSSITGGTAPYAYALDGVTFDSDAAFVNLKAGAYTVTVKDANNCLFAVEAEIENITGPTDLSATLAAATCSHANGRITVASVTGGTAPYTYALDDGIFQETAAFTAVGVGQHIITVKDVNNCTFAREVTISDIPGVTAMATRATPSACTTKTGTVSITGVTGGTAPYTYSLDNTTFASATIFTELAAGTYTVYVKDANNCRFSVSTTVTQNAIAGAVASAQPSACDRNIGVITVEAVTGGTSPYTYSIDGVQFQSETTFQNLAAATYAVMVKDAAGCTLTISQQVTNPAGVDVSIFDLQVTDARCGFADGKISLTSPNSRDYTYSMDGTTFRATAEFDGLAAGTYQIIIKDALGCSNTKAVTLGCTPPPNGLVLATAAAGCDQNNGQITVQEVTGGTGPYTYSLDGVHFSASPVLSGLAPGNYVVTVKDAKNGITTAAVTVARLSSQLAYVRDVTCAGQANGSIAITATGNNQHTEYSINNGATFQKDSIFTNLSAGVYTVITKFSAACALTVSNIEVKSPNPISATANALTKAIGQEASGSAVVAGLKGGVKPYTFQVDNGSINSDSVLTNLSGGNHTVLVQDKNGCSVSVPFVIEALDNIDIPNGFTPNNDGMNDRWVLKNLSIIYPKCRVQVFNRWGMLVFDSIGYRKEWDGTFNGKNLPDGTYYCIIELGNGEAPLKKSVTIMR